MLTHEIDQFLNSVLVQHVSLHVCKSCTEPEILKRGCHEECVELKKLVSRLASILLGELVASEIALSPIRMRKKYTRVNILRCVFILRCANQPESKFKLRSHGFYRQEYFCR